ncbi:MAG: hypothetical protein DRN54_02270 [Thaumarchaeota archaeon]|nr:MAG: hypothetical protein DRN54_02270 [Nitrososphaerota archaeon]
MTLNSFRGGVRSLKEALAKFYEAILGLKRLRRAGWLRCGVREPESVAAHSYAVALLSILLADLRGLDVAEVARMALIHDLPEAVIGDLTPEQKRREVKRVSEKELEAIADLAKSLPEEAASRYLQAWRSYAEGLSSAARLVRDVDKLEMGLQAIHYIRSGSRSAIDIYKSALKQIRDPELKRILESLGKDLA